ncbi:MAG: proline--tRNA ligase [Deltaproteobacteria bacterium]|nr:proline--tRNA ligase [Candidatus Zymogenaceae bacterium]
MSTQEPVIRYSHYLLRTRREDPTDAEIPSHKLLVKAGFIRQVAAGVFDFTPIAFRVMTRIMEIIRQEMNRIGGQELLMPVLNPASLWIETGRYNAVGAELIRFADRRGTDMCLAMTNEETVTDLARGYVSSWRDLPFMLYHIQTKIRDEARPRGGVMRVREFLMKDAYSFHRDFTDLGAYYVNVYNAYRRIFKRIGLSPVPVEADTGAMGGSASHEFLQPSQSGEDTFARCNRCGMSSNIEKAEVVSTAQAEGSRQAAAEEVHTPNMTTIDDLMSFFGVGPDRFLKAVAYDADGTIVVAFINGAYEINETKLKNALGAMELTVADSRKLTDAGIVPGFISPRIAKLSGVTVLLDRTILSRQAYVMGGDRIDYHVKSAVPGRDFTLSDTVDIASVREGDPCPRCADGTIVLLRGIELGHTFQLGTKYSESMGLTYLSEEGKAAPVVMGCYGIGVERAMASIIEAHHDETGIVWPITTAPFTVMVLPLGADAEVVAAADTTARALSQTYSVLLDDRQESAGVKFADSELLGIPIRAVVSKKLIAKGEVELKVRRTGEVVVVPQKEAPETVRSLLFGLAEKEGVMIDDSWPA